MDVLRANSGLTSFIGGTLFAIVLLAIGGGPASGVGVALAVILGAVFGLFMYRALRRARRPPPG